MHSQANREGAHLYPIPRDCSPTFDSCVRQSGVVRTHTSGIAEIYLQPVRARQSAGRKGAVPELGQFDSGGHAERHENRLSDGLYPRIYRRSGQTTAHGGKKIACFTATEQKKLEQTALTDRRIKMRGIVLCLYTGLRIGELLALEWSDIDFAKGELTVSKSCHDSKKDGHYDRRIEPPKTKHSNRVIPLPKQLMPILREMKQKNPTGYVIGGEKIIPVRSYQASFALLLKKQNLTHRGFHALRHTFATRALECGMDVKTLSELLGHKNPTVTLNRYVHSLMPHKHDMMNCLGKLL